MESEWSTFLLGVEKERAAKSPREPPLAPDMQTKLAEWKQAERECKCECVRQSKEGPGSGTLSFCLVEESLFFLNLGAEW